MAQLYLIFESELSAKGALETIYSNMVEAIQSPELLDVTQQQVFDKDELSPAEAIEYGAQKRRFPVFGINAATKATNTSDGYTTAWSVPSRTNQGSWVFLKPDDSLLSGVSGYSVAPYDPNWFSQDNS